MIGRDDRPHPSPPRGTVGYTIAGAKTPSSHRPFESSCAVASSHVTGVIGVWLSPVSNPNMCSSSLNDARVRPQPIEPVGSSPRMSSAVVQAATTAGGALVENRYDRPRFTSHRISCEAPAMKPPSTPMA